MAVHKFFHSTILAINVLKCTDKVHTMPLVSKVCGSQSSSLLLETDYAYTTQSYDQRTFTIPDNSSYEMYLLNSAPLLRYVFIQHNVNVIFILIDKCSLVSVPRTIRNVPHLRRLTIRSCRIQHLDLNDFVHLPILHEVDFNHNQIVTITEPPAGAVLAIHRLYLTYNKIRQLDMNVLHALKELHCLVVDNNRIEEFPS
uniref:Leucine rich immune protein (Coil-less) n=1 Tax=Anopheles maculatus TaxID=74869 RepID=A0A182S5T2_9DIPT